MAAAATDKPKRAPRGNEGKGRPKGAKNKITADLKDMVKTALAEEGGIDYLREQARANPKAFLALVAKLIPNKIEGDSENPLRLVNEIKCVIVDPREND